MHTPRSMKSRFPEVSFKVKTVKKGDYKGIRERGEYKPQVFTLKVIKKGGEFHATHYDDPFKSFAEVVEQATKDGWNIVKMGAIKKIIKL
jgi:hypothetical protein